MLKTIALWLEYRPPRAIPLSFVCNINFSANPPSFILAAERLLFSEFGTHPVVLDLKQIFSAFLALMPFVSRGVENSRMALVF